MSNTSSGDKIQKERESSVPEEIETNEDVGEETTGHGHEDNNPDNTHYNHLVSEARNGCDGQVQEGRWAPRGQLPARGRQRG